MYRFSAASSATAELMAKSYAIGRSVMFQAHSQNSSSGTFPSSARNASAPATPRGSSRSTPSFSLKRTRWRITAVLLVDELGHEVADALRGARYALEPYLHQVRGPGGGVDDRVEHEDDYQVESYLLRLHHRPLTPLRSPEVSIPCAVGRVYPHTCSYPAAVSVTCRVS